jgi:tRNA-specific 2-thiouridylase
MKIFRKRSSAKKAVVAMSGGVDSSLAASLLKRERRDVIGVTFRMWPKEECGSQDGRACCSLESVTRARAVAEDLRIPYYVFDLSADFKRRVIDYFCAEYLKGRTPNPCVICNEKIKFGRLLEKARSLGAEMVATGHYAAVEADAGTSRYILREGADKAHDQSYFLFSLSQDQLSRAIFPLGRYTKDRVRRLARSMKLRTHDTVSSQDVCFVRGVDYAEYIRKRTGVAIESGDIVDGSGTVLGRHKGIPFYTIGQRRGLGIAHGEPLYVTAIDMAANRVIVGPKREVMKRSFIAASVNWIAVDGLRGDARYRVKIRYNHAKAPANVSAVDAGTVRVEFDEPQEAPTPGQAAVFYDGDKVVGGGWIEKIKN